MNNVLGSPKHGFLCVHLDVLGPQGIVVKNTQPPFFSVRWIALRSGKKKRICLILVANQSARKEYISLLGIYRKYIGNIWAHWWMYKARSRGTGFNGNRLFFIDLKHCLLKPKINIFRKAKKKNSYRQSTTEEFRLKKIIIRFKL